MSKESYWDHIAEAYDSVSIYDGAKVFESGLRKYPEWIRDLLAAHWILSEILNGGFTQFFLNDTGVVAPEAATGFSRMGLPGVSDMVQKAMRLFGADYPRNNEERTKILAAKSGHKPDDEDWSPFKPDHFDAIEKELYAFGGSDLGKIYDAMDAYAKTSAAKPLRQPPQKKTRR